MRKCYSCQQLLSLDMFYKGRYQCKTCEREYNRKFRTNHKGRYQKYWYRSNGKLMERNKDFIWSYFLEHHCVDCGERDPLVLEFDHLHSKTTEVSVLVTRGHSINTIKLEIEKCDVVCSNCHRRRTAQRQNSYFYQKANKV